MKRIIYVVLSLFILGSFSAAKEKKLDKYDLDNPKFYTYSKYRSLINQPIYLDVEMIDKRPASELDIDTTIWQRPMAAMMKSVIEKELQITNIAKPSTAISSLNQYKIDIEILLFTAKTQVKEGNKAVKWAIPQVAIGNTELRVTISTPDGIKINTTEYSGEASRDLIRIMDPRYWTMRMAATSFQTAMEQVLKDLDNILSRPSK